MQTYACLKFSGTPEGFRICYFSKVYSSLAGGGGVGIGFFLESCLSVLWMFKPKFAGFVYIICDESIGL